MVQFNKFETAILLDVYIDIVEKTLTKSNGITIVSNLLRQMAINTGIIIDDTYRSIKGITYQMRCMANAYMNVNQKVPSLFAQIVKMYNDDIEKYLEILVEAWQMASENKIIKKLDFLNDFSLSSTTPYSLSICNKVIDIKRNWEDVYVNLISYLHEIYPDVFNNLTDTFYLECNLCADDLMSRAKKFLDLCNISYDNVVINYMFKGEDTQMIKNNTNEIHTINIDDKTLTINQDFFEDKLLKCAYTIVLQVFPNGMRLGSAIAQRKFKAKYEELNGTILDEKIDIDKLVSQIGILHDNKIYAISSENINVLKSIIETITYNVVFYDELYNTYQVEFAEINIFSSEFLKDVLMKLFSDKFFFKNYYSSSPTDDVETEILKLYDKTETLSYYQIKEQLPFIPLEQIKLICSRSKMLVRNSEASYTIIDKIKISNEDVEKSEEIISNEIKKDGFSVLNHMDTTYSEELNPDVSSTAIKKIMFIRYFSNRYELNRLIITLIGNSLSIHNIIIKYCENFDTLKLKDVEEYEKSLIGRNIYALKSACETMVRIDKENFVKKDAIHFDVATTDKAIDVFSNGRIISYSQVDSFVTFPFIEGYSWNEYLLESFCRQFSQRYKTMESIAKKRPTGAIIPARMNFDNFNDLLAQVVVDNHIELNDKSVNDFLTRQTYILRKTDTEVIISKAHNIKLREE